MEKEKIVCEPKGFSWLFVTWMSPVLKTGSKRPLNVADLPPLPHSFYAGKLYEKMASSWNGKSKEYKNKKYSYIRTFVENFGTPFFMAGACLIPDLLNLACPMLLRLLLEEMAAPSEDRYRGLGLCFGIFALQMTSLIFMNAYFILTGQTGLNIRTVTSALIFSKSLKLSNSSRQQFSTGTTLNLMSNDVSNLETTANVIHYMWSGPLQILINFAMLFYLVRWSALIGFGTMIVFIPIQSKITAYLSRFNEATSSASDKRVKIMQEIIQGIRVIKFYAWENCFLKQLFELREAELGLIKKSLGIRSLTSALTQTTAVFSCIVTFIAYHFMGNSLTPEVVFPVIAIFNMLKLPLILFPMFFGLTVSGSVSTKRIQEFLLGDELDFAPEIELESKYGVQVLNGKFSATSNKSKDKFVEEVILSDINMNLEKGSLTAIVGNVGSGKSTLLNSLVGELKMVEGRVIFGGNVAYCPQQAWLQNASIRDNILFGSPFNEKRYSDVISSCALYKDFEILPDGDLTEVGEKGVNLSGGQKQRISLARAAYSTADIVLLDDPLSAVDAQVGKHLLDNCINGVMADRTVVLVTHQLSILPKVDHVIVMDSGRIIEQGSLNELLHEESNLTRLIQVGGVSLALEKNNSRPRTPQSNIPVDFPPTPLPPILNDENSPSSPLKTITDEERNFGAIDSSVFKEYLAAAGGPKFVLAAIFSVILWNVFRILNDYWPAAWEGLSITTSTFIGVYCLLGFMQVLLRIFNCILFFMGGWKASRSLHSKASKKVIHAHVSFFDTNPTGRILGRFSKDLNTLDDSIPDELQSVLGSFGMIVFAFLTIVIANWIFIFPLILLSFMYFTIQNYYRSSSREIKRLDGLARSPLYSQFNETLTGLSTIRAFRKQNDFFSRHQALLDSQNKVAYSNIAIQRWLSIRSESVGNTAVFSAVLACYLFKVNRELAGLAISNSFGVTFLLIWLIRQLASSENQFISVERIGHYANKLESEEALLKDLPNRSADSWPSQGGIEFRDVTLSYRPELPPVLKNVSFSVKPGERVGIVGRTGAGKSSILQALFRMVEAKVGDIIIDGIKTKTVNLKLLRSRLSIIPQDPVVFAGTIRWNLDPNGEFNDSDLWLALERSHLKSAVMRMEGGLDSELQEGGQNLSVGQRQLLCLARAVLRNNKILILDEATANIDLATDSLIQESIRSDFTGYTILTIAHRLSTVMDYDRILVLDKGEVVEYDTPANLLDRSDSLLSLLVQESGPENAAILHMIAHQKRPQGSQP